MKTNPEGSSEMYETKIGVDGMMCAMCEAHVAGAVRDALGTKCVKATASRKSKCCTVLTEEPVPEEVFRDALKPTGYDMTSFNQGPQEKKKGFFAKLFG